MTKSIDERIVEMQFNNKQFESGISTSLKSIDKLKQGLNFDKAANSLAGLERAGSKFSLAGISDTLDRISSKFSALSVIGITALANLTTAALQTGTQFVKSLTIDPITTGLNEYETKMNAIQTILTNTKSKGTTLTDVTKSLDELNEYSDKTIYNFAEMAKNIGTFTAAGVDLKTSTSSIKGIANLAAGSGSSALQASTAMYQLSQAIAAGSVKLIDWNSVVNAGMGGELFQIALKKTAREMGIFVDESKPFRETLEQGWITSDVLTKTLSQFAEDADLVKAATEVKTFTMLIDTMKESVQSGWAKSWEYMLGDKEQAAKFFTSINDGFGKIVGGSADARNATLAFWNANGGRDAIIKALSNAFKGLETIVKPIGEAFREIFPAITGKRLIEISKSIRDLTVKFKIGEATAENLKNTFKGLFALLDIGKQVFTGVAKSLAAMFGFVLPVGDSFLSLTGSIGEFIVSIDKALKSSNAFNNVFKKIGEVAIPIATGIRTAIIALINAIASLGDIDLGGFDSLTKKMNLTFEPLTSLANFASNVGGVFYGLATAIGAVFEKIRKFILGMFNMGDFNHIFDAINSGLFAAILLSIKKFVDSLSSLSNRAGGLMGGITGTLDGVGDSLKALQASLKAETLLKIALSLGILALALLTISKIDSKKLKSSLGAITALFLELFAAMATFEFIIGTSGFLAMITLTTGMIGLSIGILILVSAMKKMSQLDWDGVATGLAAVAGMAAILVVSSKMMATSSVMLIRSALALIVFAVAVNVLAKAVEKLGKLNTGALTKGLVGIGVLLASLSMFMTSTNLNNLGMIRAAGILIFAGAINVLASAVKKLGSVDAGDLIKGLTSMAVILAEIVVFTRVIDGRGLIASAAGLTVLGMALMLISQAVTRLGNMSWSEMSRGLLTMAGALLAITVAFNTLPKTIFLQSIAIVDVAGAMMLLANALKLMAELSWEQIARGLSAMALSLGLVLGAFMLLSKGALVDSTAFLLLATAITILAGALKTLSGITLPQLGMGLLALASAFTLFGIAGLVLAPLVPVILGLSTALVIFGVGVAAIGAGILMLSTGLIGLAGAGAAASVTLVALVTSIAGLIPFIFKSIGQGIVEFAKALADGSKAISSSIVTIITTTLKAITGLIPSLVNMAGKLIITILDSIEKYIPDIIDSGMNILISFLEGIEKHIKEVTVTAIGVVIKFIDGVESKLPDLIQSGFDLMVAFINGLADAVVENAPIVTLAILNLITALPRAGLNVLGTAIQGFFNIGKNIVMGLINGIKSMISSVASTVGNLGSTILISAKRVLGIRSPSTVFKEEVGKMIGEGLAAGITKSTPKAVTASKQMSKSVVNASKEAFDKAVEWIDDRKYYNKLSLAEELKCWQELQTKYKEGCEERKKADREVYRVEKEINRASFDNSVKWINNKKYYNELGLSDELAAWKRVQVRYLDGTAEREEADKEIYRVQREINSANEDYAIKSAQIQENAASKRKDLEDDYYAKTKEINDNLINDIKNVTAEYDNAVKSRADSLYSAYGLFDKVDPGKSVSGDQLLRNLKGQVTAFGSWQASLNTLANKGVDDEFIQELKEMGPKSAAQITALNKLSGAKLDEYVSLWRMKHYEAKEEATSELEYMRIEMIDKISELNSNAADELKKYKTIWFDSMAAVYNDSTKQLAALQTEWSTKMGLITANAETKMATMGTNVATTVTTMSADTEKEFTSLATNIQTIMSKPDWISVGANIVNGITQGVRSKSAELANETAQVALTALRSAKNALGVKSPSKAFAEVGMYAIEGFVVGLSNVSSVVSSAKDVGDTAVNSLRDVISKVADSVSGDLDLAPTIRPVLDLTNVEAGKSKLGSMFNTSGINVSATNGRVSSIVSGLKTNNAQSVEKPTSGQNNQNGSNIALDFDGLFRGAEFVIRNDNDIPKIAKAVSQELYYGGRSVSRGRGLVTT